MDQVTKALRRLSKTQRKKLLDLIATIETGNVSQLDVVKLKGYRSLYRVRQGDLRLILRRQNGTFMVLLLEGRSETTYQHLDRLDK